MAGNNNGKRCPFASTISGAALFGVIGAFLATVERAAPHVHEPSEFNIKK
jgi:hypothetical protein